MRAKLGGHANSAAIDLSYVKELNRKNKFMAKSQETLQKLEKILREEFGADVQIEDQSHHHAGHRAAGGGGHFYAEIRSARFQGLTPLARQRLVFAAVKPLMDKEIHALSLRCLVKE